MTERIFDSDSFSGTTGTNHCWGIVLAGGEGLRLLEFTKSLFGAPLPKQFCAFTGTRSMFKHTFDRVNLLLPSERILTVICKDHLHHATGHLKGVELANVVLLPRGKETASSILYPLLRIAQHDPDGIVGLFPSDHFIVEEQKFMDYVRSAFEFVRGYPDDLVVLGVDAEYPETEYGWIEPEERVEWEHGTDFFRVKRFWEKPDRDLAQALLSRKYLWNTFVTVGTVRRFLTLFQNHLPKLHEPFKEIAHTIGTIREWEAVENVFQRIPSLNFSSDLLQRIPRSLCVLPVQGVHWSDWGNPNRILHTLASLKLSGRPLQTTAVQNTEEQNYSPHHIER
jgi:mannose-1-phosphate guanylyltransferase